MKYLIRVFLLLFLLFNLVHAQNSSFQEAKALSHNGSFQEAGIIFNKLLGNHPEDQEILLAAAYNFAWNHDLEQARRLFNLVLKETPGHSDAYSGLGYVYAWEGNYFLARKFFKKILESTPDYTEAHKGIAYTYLWEGNSGEAIRRFQVLLNKNPTEAEYHEALGQSYLLKGKLKEARKEFMQAQLIEPERVSVTELLSAMRTTPAFVEVDIWGGFTNFQEQDNWGIRAGQISVRPIEKLRILGRYDNSLTLDNFSLSQKNLGAGAGFLGGIYQWNKKIITRLEIGRRFQQELANQNLIQVEQVIFLNSSISTKIGGYIGFGLQSRPEWMSYFGVNFPLNKRVSIEPMYFFNQPSKGAFEQRFMLNGKTIFPLNIEMNAGLIYGQSRNETALQSDNLFGFNLLGRAPIGKKYWMQFLYRYETNSLQNFSVLALGGNIRFE